MTHIKTNPQTLLVRIHEASCQIQYPTPAEAQFRAAVMKKLGREFRVKGVRTETRVTTATPVIRPVPVPVRQVLRLAKRAG